MSPLYDHGSSLGCGLDKVGLDRAFDDSGVVKPAHIYRMRKNGRHHVRIDAPDNRGSRFEDLCTAFLVDFPEGRRWFEEAGNMEVDAVRSLMVSICAQSGLPEPYCLSERRQTHICTMLTLGKERIKNILDGDRFDD